MKEDGSLHARIGIRVRLDLNRVDFGPELLEFNIRQQGSLPSNKLPRGVKGGLAELGVVFMTALIRVSVGGRESNLHPPYPFP